MKLLAGQDVMVGQAQGNIPGIHGLPCIGFRQLSWKKTLNLSNGQTLSALARAAWPRGAQGRPCLGAAWACLAQSMHGPLAKRQAQPSHQAANPKGDKPCTAAPSSIAP